MDYEKKETEIIEATREFATSHNIHYDSLTESMVLNAMRELNKCFMTNVSGMYRLGRKSKRAVLDHNGLEIVVFNKGQEQMAQEFVNYLNGKLNKDSN